MMWRFFTPGYDVEESFVCALTVIGISVSFAYSFLSGIF